MPRSSAMSFRVTPRAARRPRILAPNGVMDAGSWMPATLQQHIECAAAAMARVRLMDRDDEGTQRRFIEPARHRVAQNPATLAVALPRAPLAGNHQHAAPAFVPAAVDEGV